MKRDIVAEEVLESLMQFRDEEQRKVLCRFFKTGPGQYGEGDQFLGLRVPQTRLVVKEAALRIGLNEIEKLISSQWHEARLAGFLLLVEEMKAALPRKRRDSDALRERRREIAEFYLLHAAQANNWDLVDLSCQYIVGEWILYAPENSHVLDRLASSDNLWEQRIAVVTTLRLIRADIFDDAIRISTKLLDHQHDLIHKAVGWILREAGKRDVSLLRRFLWENYALMSRTTLRYAIEKFSDDERQYWLSDKDLNRYVPRCRGQGCGKRQPRRCGQDV